MMNKKGLSDVVTNVLLILFVVIAVGMLWYFISPLIMKTGEKIETQQICMNVALEPAKCASSGTDANVSIRRREGAGEVSEIKLIFEMADGQTEVKTESSAIGELETRNYNVTGLKENPKKFSVAAGILDSNGNIVNCAESVKILCSAK